MKRILIALVLAPLCGAFLCQPALAQKTKAQLTTEVGTTYPDNTSGSITPLGVRTYELDVINSIMPTAPVVAGNLACFNGTTGLLQDCGSAPATVPLTIGVTPINSAVSGNVLYANGAVLGQYSNTQLTALINPATSLLSGALPAWPNDTTKFFRGDGSYVTLNCAALSGVAASCSTDATNASNITTGTLANGRYAAVNLAAGNVNGGVTGALPLTNLPTGTLDTALGYFGSTTVNAIGITNCANALTYSTSTHTFGCNSLAGTGTVTSVGSGAGLVGGPVTSSGTLTIEQANPGGRLTVTSAVPVMVTAAANQTTLYYAPYSSRFVPIYNGTTLQLYPFTASTSDAVGQSLVLGSNWAANTLYDAFEGLNAGSPVLCTGPAWSTSTSRGTGAGTTQLAIYNGLQTNAVSMTCRTSNSTTITCAVNQCTYVGTVLTDATNAGQITWTPGSAASGGGAARLSIWNAFNREPVRAQVLDSGTQCTYSTATVREHCASTTFAVTFVSGGQVDAFTAKLNQMVSSAANGAIVYQGIALDSISSMDHQWFHTATSASSDFEVATVAGDYAPQLGSHFVAGLERGDGTNTMTVAVGTNATGAPNSMLELQFLM